MGLSNCGVKELQLSERYNTNLDVLSESPVRREVSGYNFPT